MTAPIWMALPPEVHSTLLSAGAGPGSLLAAAAQWQQLSVQYSQAAAELSAILADVNAGSWEGATAEQYVLAHVPYLAWLEQSSVDAAAAGAQHEAAAAAYGTAMATMPSLAELAANHLVNGVLVATNFFGINTIPIALNEADYARMWIQAAETMTVYQGVSATALAAVPSPTPAPAIVKFDVNPQGLLRNPPTSPTEFLNDLLTFIEQLGTTGQIQQMLADFQYFFEQLGFNPASAAVLAFIALWLYDVLWYPYYASYSLLLTPFLAPALSALSALLLLRRPALDVLPLVADPAHPDLIRPAAPHADNSAMPSPVVVPGGTAPTGSPSSPAAASATAASPAPASVASYAVMGPEPPEVDSGPVTDLERPDSVANPVAAAIAARALAGVRSTFRQTRKVRGRGRGYRYEFLDMEGSAEVLADTPASDVAASNSGAGTIGFTGARRSTGATPAGMAAESDRAPGRTVPLLPSTWLSDSGDEPT